MGGFIIQSSLPEAIKIRGCKKFQSTSKHQLHVDLVVQERKKHFKNEQRKKDAAAKKRANTSGVGKSNNYYEDIHWAKSLMSMLWIGV